MVAEETAATLEEAEDPAAEAALDFASWLVGVDTTEGDDDGVLGTRRPPATLHMDADWERFVAAVERVDRECQEADDGLDGDEEYVDDYDPDDYD